MCKPEPEPSRAHSHRPSHTQTTQGSHVLTVTTQPSPTPHSQATSNVTSKRRLYSIQAASEKSSENGPADLESEPSPSFHPFLRSPSQVLVWLTIGSDTGEVVVPDTQRGISHAPCPILPRPAQLRRGVGCESRERSRYSPYPSYPALTQHSCKFWHRAGFLSTSRGAHQHHLGPGRTQWLRYGSWDR